MRLDFCCSKFCFSIKFTALLISLLPICAIAQQSNVTIKIINAKKEPLPFASVTVKALKDSATTFQKVSDSLGVSRFYLANDQYLVSVSSINYAPFQKGISVKGENAVFTFTADVLSKSLQGVSIISSRPVIRQEDDKTIVDPENLAASSTNAYEILEKNTWIIC